MLVLLLGRFDVSADAAATTTRRPQIDHRQVFAARWDLRSGISAEW